MGCMALNLTAMATIESRPLRRPFVDFSSVPGHQWDMHQRLLNWATASRDLKRQQVSAGFALFRSDEWEKREYGAETVTVVDQRDAQKVHFGVTALPEAKLRPAIQWYYLKNGKDPAGMAREFGVTMQRLTDLVREARQTLIDRGV